MKDFIRHWSVDREFEHFSSEIETIQRCQQTQICDFLYNGSYDFD
jgi:hypothetical protein